MSNRQAQRLAIRRQAQGVGKKRAGGNLFPARALKAGLGSFKAGLGPLLATAALFTGMAAASAEPAWSELKGPLQGASYGEAGGIALFVLGCGTGSDAFVQAPLPEGMRPRPGHNATFYLEVDGRRFAVRGRIAVDEKAEGGPRGAVVAPVRLDNALVKALISGKQMTLGQNGKKNAAAVPIDTTLIAKAVETCGAPAPERAAPSRSEAAAQPGTPQPTTAEAPAAQAPAPQVLAPQVPAPQAASSEPAKPARGAVPPAREIAAAIFVDAAEGQRVADKLKITPVDLNGDGAPEAIITLNDPTWCGDTGCTWFVVDLSGKPRVMGQFIGLGLTPGKDSNDGWRDLSLKTPGGSERMYYKDGTYH